MENVGSEPGDDELQIQYDLLTESVEQLKGFYDILNNERSDEDAVRIKEQSIYRLV